jgi:hypothetical protein
MLSNRNEIGQQNKVQLQAHSVPWQTIHSIWTRGQRRGAGRRRRILQKWQCSNLRVLPKNFDTIGCKEPTGAFKSIVTN